MTDRTQFQEQHGITGESVEIKEIIDVILQVAPTDITVLITGESGVGKEVIAKAIHQASKRADKPMISVNAGAIPEGIIESELFGHEKGRSPAPARHARDISSWLTAAPFFWTRSASCRSAHR